MEGDVINVMGFDISPVEVEEGLLLHPAIEEAAVIGVPDAYLGQTIKAFILLRMGIRVMVEAICLLLAKVRMINGSILKTLVILSTPSKMKAAL